MAEDAFDVLGKLQRQHAAHLLAMYCVPSKHVHLALSQPPSGAWEVSARLADESMERTWRNAVHFTPPEVFRGRLWLPWNQGGLQAGSALESAKCKFFEATVTGGSCHMWYGDGAQQIDRTPDAFRPVRLPTVAMSGGSSWGVNPTANCRCCDKYAPPRLKRQLLPLSGGPPPGGNRNCRYGGG